MTREEMIEALIQRDLEINTDESTLYELFKSGCKGYDNMSDQEIEILYETEINGN